MNSYDMNRRHFLALSAAAGVSAVARGVHAAEADGVGVDLSKWSPDYVRSIAGTEHYDTAAECYRVVPKDYSGRLTYWYYGPDQSSPQIDFEMDKAFWAAFKELYPNIKVDAQNLSQKVMLGKLRTGAMGNAAPMVARMPITWGAEFASKGQLMEFGPEDAGYSRAEFWPAALRSVTWQGKTYGVPTNNETMPFIWNAEIFREAGLNPELPPDTWDDVVRYSKQIKERTGKNGFGMVARVGAGNTSTRFMPQAWSYGGGALDEAEVNPSYRTTSVNSEGMRAALQASVDMYVRDKSVPVSALTNTQQENQDPFSTGNLAMMIAQPAEYLVMVERAKKATGPDKEIAQSAVDNMRFGLMPRAQKRRAGLFSGGNLHVFHPDTVDGGLDVNAAKAIMAFATGPEWTTKIAWVRSNPGNLRGFKTKWMKERLETVKGLDVGTAMLPYGLTYPVVPQASEIMDVIIPTMLQNALTEKMTVAEATDDAAAKINELLTDL
ncbi:MULTISPECIES: extracellular solute-binding protein [unclassified Rhizobium]|uniref:extracellular solute-binding protein n=1 Tax=unclassified Rhizobium TaxID=2613769 RepID=UPI001ADB9BD1|nr:MULTISPECIES: extracellular solute-binding protein [unclassified Rhizobium]MBO9126371.1 extracellular solute-binding protein [Rhizobium sp. 16-488-2b]MBO9178099.1 extracellular solute-binding protein [Rhizobium sp. 16-488-2a]